MGKPRVIVLRAAGINCDAEICRAWELAGAEWELVHVNALIDSPATLDRFDILTIPGGFSYGDDIAAGRIFARRLMHHLGDAIRAFVSRNKLVLGICNGFQILVEAGLLPGSDTPPCALTANACGHFVCRWVSLEASSQPCVFLEANRRYFLPIAHAEGRFVPDEESGSIDRHVAMRYVDDVPRVGPANPNGSFDNVAALTDATGRVLGMMPHPERHVDRHQHPYWTATGNTNEPDGLAIFRAAVSSIR